MKTFTHLRTVLKAFGAIAVLGVAGLVCFDLVAQPAPVPRMRAVFFGVQAHHCQSGMPGPWPL